MTYTTEDLTGDLIRQTRLALHRTQQQFAELMGVSNVTVSRWEGGSVPQSESHKRAIVTLANKYLQEGESR